MHALALAGATGLAALAGPAPARADDSSPMRFQIVASGADCGGCVVINASGEIMDNTARDFSLFVATNRLKGILPKEPKKAGAAIQAAGGAQPRVVVAFSSIGGKVVPALIMGRRIRQLGWSTIVGQGRRSDAGVTFESTGCYSACSMVMLGGVNRYIVPGSREGLHQFQPQFTSDESFNADEMNQIVRDYGRQVVGVFDYVHDLGVDPAFFVTTLRTPFTSMDVVPKDRWQELGLVTAMLPENAPVTMASLAAAASLPAATPDPATTATLAQPGRQTALEPEPTGVWTVLRQGAGSSQARFASADVSVAMSCQKPDAARLEVTFKDLDPINLERLRAAAFASKRLRLAEREVAIESVAAPGQGEQGLDALLNLGDLKALKDVGTLTLAVLDKAGVTAGRSASVTGSAKAITDMMAVCLAN